MLFLADHCDILRPGRQPQGYGGKQVYAPHLSNVPCRVIAKQQRGFNSLTAEWIVETQYSIVFRNDIDVAEGDRITNIVLHDGTHDARNYRVDGGVITRRGRMASAKIAALKQVT